MKMYLLAASLLLFTAAPGMARHLTAQSQAGQAAPQTTAQTVSGEIVSINPNNNELVVKDRAGKEMKLMTNDATKVMREGKSITLAELKTNERVTCECEQTADGWTAKSIQVMAMKASQ
jgi:hypothetical protein